jgi:tuftelin-interacting protein 11
MNAYTATQTEMSDEEEEGAMQGGGLGFSLGRRKFDDDGVTSQSTQKKKMKFTPSSAAPMAGTANSFAARMMAKMGYVEGQGLGADGRGRLAPIETQLRPQGVGLGAVKEKTKQAKDEEKREAAFRGQVIEDSSEEEKERRRRRKESRVAGGGSGTSTPGRGRQKIKYKTAAQIEADSGGLEVPNVLKTIIDITGKETKLLTSTDGLLTPGVNLVPSETASTRIAKQARRELEAFADEWRGLADRKTYYDLTHSQLISELDSGQEEVQRMKSLVEGVQGLQILAAEDFNASGRHSARWEPVTKKLAALEVDFHDERDSYGLHEITVAAIHPMFRAAMNSWAPLEDPGNVSSYIQRLSHLLNIHNASSSSAAMIRKNGYQGGRAKRPKATTEYETMIYTLWLPPVRTAVTNQWDPYNPTPLITLLTIWKPLLPEWVFQNLIDQQVIPRITKALTDWKPSHKKKRHEIPPPHIWIFPWLPHLPSYHTDSSSHSEVSKSPWATDESGFGVLSQVKNKLKSLLQSHNIASGPPSYLSPWQQLLPVAYPNLLTRHLLPRLAAYLHSNFRVDPSNQDLTPLTTVLEYAPLFPHSTLAALFVAELFPQWHEILHIWLTSCPAYDEIKEWFLWWKEQLPNAISTHPLIDAEWTKGLSTINHALELGPDAATQLPAPAAGPACPLVPSTETPALKVVNGNTSTPSKPSQIEEISFKDVVEAWCAEQNLLMMPLREAHMETGSPLFRITASASGKGGVKVYLKGDVVWGRDKKGAWKPVGLDEGLVEMAEG